MAKSIIEHEYSVRQISVLFKFPSNTIEYLLHKYRDVVMTEKKWIELFKKDGLSYNI